MAVFTAHNVANPEFLGANTEFLPELVQIKNGGAASSFQFSGPNDSTPDSVEFFRTANPTHVVLHGGLSDLVIAGAQPASMTVTSLEVTENGAQFYEISGISFQLSDLYDDANNNGFLNSIPSQIFGGDDTLTGADENDLLRAFAGSDHVFGNKGSDALDGGTGKDFLSGGKGHDVFVFTSLEPSVNADHITDFKHGKDRLAFVGADFTVLLYANGDLKAGMFRLGTKAKDSSDHILYNQKKGAVFFDDDGNGPDAKVKVTILDNHPTIDNHDIFNGLLLPG
jgi:Ca2+-binding RTX toxin-like protein